MPFWTAFGTTSPNLPTSMCFHKAFAEELVSLKDEILKFHEWDALARLLLTIRRGAAEASSTRFRPLCLAR
jgi:hypothetical protein